MKLKDEMKNVKKKQFEINRKKVKCENHNEWKPNKSKIKKKNNEINWWSETLWDFKSLTLLRWWHFW